MKRTFFLTVITMLVIFSSCKKSDLIRTNGECFADKIKLTETAVDVIGENLIITFDAKNTSAKDYNVDKGDKLINLKFVITTTDGSKYESTYTFLVAELSAGTTVSTPAGGTFGAGKTYQSYTMTASCQ